MPSSPEYPPHPTLRSDVAFKNSDAVDHGTLSVSSSTDPSVEHHWWIETRAVLASFELDRRAAGLNTFLWTPFTSRGAWDQYCPEAPITQSINIRSPSPANVLQPAVSQQSASSSFLPPPPPPPPARSPASSTSSSRAKAPAPPPALPALSPGDLSNLITLLTQQATQHGQILTQLASPLAPALTSTPASALVPSRSNSLPRPPFPTWNGSPGDRQLFLAQLNAFKSDDYFLHVTN